MKSNFKSVSWSLTLLAVSGAFAATPADKPTPPPTKTPSVIEGACESPTLLGWYGFVAMGTVPSKSSTGAIHLVPIQEFGEVLYRSDGTAKTKIKVVMNGASTVKVLSGKYAVDATTCAGTVQWADGDGPTWGFVIVAKGTEIDTIDARGDGSAQNPVGALVFIQKKI